MRFIVAKLTHIGSIRSERLEKGRENLGEV
jgi:hypothetical protein